MTSARIVTPGQAMAKIPTTTARLPRRISEGDVDSNMTVIPFAYLSRTTVKSVVRVMFSRHDGPRFRPTPAAYSGIATGYGQLTKDRSGFLRHWRSRFPAPRPGRRPRRAVSAVRGHWCQGAVELPTFRSSRFQLLALGVQLREGSDAGCALVTCVIAGFPPG